jgi:DNA-binding NtrC family response regulator
MSTALYPRFPIAIVDDEETILASVSGILKAEGISNVITVQDPRRLEALIAERGIAVILLDLIMPVVGGVELLSRIRQDFPRVSVAIVTGNKDVDRAIECMKLGAADYLTKPVERARLITTVKRLIEIQDLASENQAIRDRLLDRAKGRSRAFEPIVGGSEAIDRVMRYAEAIAPSSHPVLITGETGVGKELFARAVHELSGRSGAFVATNAAGHDDAFFSDLLFGHRAGAYTGSVGALDGLLDRAKDGTLFLDEIGDLSRSSQVKLLRTIETGEYYPIGSDLMKRSKARIIVATNRELDKAMADGSFRRDLFFRLHSHHIEIPPLRERLVDLPLLVEHFLRKASLEIGREPPIPGPGLHAALSAYSFPGNVRELEAMIFEALTSRAGDFLGPEAFPQLSDPLRVTCPVRSACLEFPDPLPSLKEISDLLVTEALARAHGNQTIAARLIGVSPQAISKRLKQRSD